MRNHAAEWIVLVGATGSFGTVIVRRLSRLGYKILAVGRAADTLHQLASDYPDVKVCLADVTEDRSIQLINSALDGPVRMVVHGPGVSVGGGVMDVSIEGLTDAVNIKVGGLLRVVRAVDKHLLEHSRLVAIGGHYGFEPTAYAAAAGVANSALMSVVRQLSLAYGPRLVTAHLVAPGPSMTERLLKVAAHRAALQECSVEDVLADMRAESSMGRFTEPEEVAWAIEILLAPEATAMTGSALMLDAGRRRGLS